MMTSNVRVEDPVNSGASLREAQRAGFDRATTSLILRRCNVAQRGLAQIATVAIRVGIGWRV